MVLIALTRLLRNSENQTGTAPQKGNSQPRPEKKPPGYRFRHYDHPSEEQHRTAEQFAWRTAKNLGIWTGVAASLAALFAFWTWYETRSQANAAWDQARTAREALVTSTRARLKIIAITDASVTRSGNSIVAWFNFGPTYKNFGQNPAQGISFNPHIFVVGAGPSPTEVCEEDRARQQGTTEMSDEVVFPQDEGGEQSVGVQILLDDLVRGADRVHSIQASATIYLGVVGCLVYQSTDSTTAYVTGFVADLHPARHTDPANYVSVYDTIIGNNGGSSDIKMSVKTLGAWAD